MPQSTFSARTAGILHIALTISSLMAIGVVWFIRGGTPMTLAPTARETLGYAAYAMAATLLGITMFIRSRIPAFERGKDVNEWWGTYGPRFVVLWALGEGGCIAGAVFWLLTDNQYALLALSGVGFLTLAAYRPSKLMELQ